MIAVERGAWLGELRQAGRAHRRLAAGARAPQFLGELLAGQLGLATPLDVRAVRRRAVAALRGAARRDPAGDACSSRFSLPGLLVFLEHALGDRVQANWLAVLYPPLAIAAAAVGQRWWRAAAGLRAWR